MSQALATLHVIPSMLDADGHKQITPFFFVILSILSLDPITGYLLESVKGGS
jgi:hypothetical protein